MRVERERPVQGEPGLVSVVVPLYDEEDNVVPLVERIFSGLACLHRPWELILVDDASRDATARRIAAVARCSPEQVRGVLLQRNFGQTAAIQAGIDSAAGEIIVTLDGDLQNDPADIPRMVERLEREDLDMLAGWRRTRKDNLWLRRIPSRLANRLIAGTTGVRLHDYGCSLRVYRADLIRKVRLYGEMHRFIPAWIATITSPARIGEEPVGHEVRVHGRSKYGLSRTFKVPLDLVAMLFFLRYRARPGHFFGRIGLLSGAAGAAVLVYLSGLKLFFGEDIGERPMLIMGLLLFLTGLQLVCTGIIAELLVRIHFESTETKTYQVRNVVGKPLPDSRAGSGARQNRPWKTKRTAAGRPFRTEPVHDLVRGERNALDG